MNKITIQGAIAIISICGCIYFWATHQPAPEALTVIMGGAVGIFIKDKAEQAAIARKCQ